MPAAISSKAHKNEAREHIRQAKARAVQEGRKLKQQAQVGTKFLPQIAKALFNVSHLTMGKAVKHVPEAHKAQGTRLKTSLQAVDKTLRLAILGKSEVDVSAKECETLIADSDSWHQRSIAILTARAMKF